MDQIEEHVHGEQTLEENLADNDGLLIAFHAYENWRKRQHIHEKILPGLRQYTAEQLFFINFSQLWCSKADKTYKQIIISRDEHALEKFRVKGTTSNLFEFDRAFQCKPGQGNSRINKCHI